MPVLVEPARVGSTPSEHTGPPTRSTGGDRPGARWAYRGQHHRRPAQFRTPGRTAGLRYAVTGIHRLNGGGYIDWEYGVGRGRIDLAIRWPYTDPDGKRRLQQEAVELKVWRPKQPDPLPEGLHQLDSHLDRLGLDHGTLVVFDRRDRSVAPAGRIEFANERTPSGRPVRLLRAQQ